MANSRWYPPPGHPQDEVNRIAFDNLYHLLDNQKATNSSANSSGGMSGTMMFPGGFLVGNNTYYQVIFKNGVMVAFA